MDTGNPLDRVYTRDLFTLQESLRLGVGVMEMTDTTFPGPCATTRWTTCSADGWTSVSAERPSPPGRGAIYIPKDSSIQFSVTGHARFLYFVYPADWQSQGG